MHETIPHPSDLDLVTGALEGEPGGVNTLMERLACVPAMVRAKNRRMGRILNSHEEEDAAQGALIALWSKLGNYTGKSPLETWAYGFCMVEIMRALERRRGVRQAVTLEEEALPPQPNTEPRIDAEAVAQALRNLAPDAAEVVRLKHFAGLIFEDIAERLQIPITTAKTRYYRALERLRPMLSQEHTEAAE